MNATKQLGDTLIKLPVIGQGIGQYSWNDQHVAIIRKGVELGMNFMDTAESYDCGRSEEIIGKAIKGIRKQVIIGTKFSPEHSSCKAILAAVEGSLKRLNTDYVDLYQMHWPNPSLPLEETLSAMQQIVKEGKARYIGLGNMYLEKLREAVHYIGCGKIASLQLEYNLFDRTVEEGIISFCDQNKIILIAYTPLNHGRIVEGKEEKAVLEAVAEKYNKSPAQVALRWLINKNPVITIPKAVTIGHIQENAASADFDLTPDDIEIIDKAFNKASLSIAVNRIKVDSRGLDKFVPQPKALAKEIKTGVTIKPIRVSKTKDTSGKYDYDLVEGKLRYWAWVMSCNGKLPISALVK